jgi:hypothetical protein
MTKSTTPRRKGSMDDGTSELKEDKMSDLTGHIRLSARCTELGLKLQPEYGITEAYQILGESPVWVRRMITSKPQKLAATKREVRLVLSSGDQSLVERWHVSAEALEGRLQLLEEKAEARAEAKANPKGYYARKGQVSLATLVKGLDAESLAKLRELLVAETTSEAASEDA